MRVMVDLDECLGYGNCVVEAPEVFEFAQDGMQVHLLQESPSQDFRAIVEVAALDCPAKAITVVD